MRVVVVGATGKTGRHVVSAALAVGHTVTAFGRSIERFQNNDPSFEAFRGDALDPESARGAVVGHDAVIVCLGSSGLRDRSTLSVGTKTVIDAMVTEDVDRLVVMSAAGVGESWKQIPQTSRLLFHTLLRNVYRDHQDQEAIVEQSPLDWTIVRAAVLKDDPGTGHYTATNTGPITKINRADVALALVDQLADSTYEHEAISVTN